MRLFPSKIERSGESGQNVGIMPTRESSQSPIRLASSAQYCQLARSEPVRLADDGHVRHLWIWSTKTYSSLVSWHSSKRSCVWYYGDHSSNHSWRGLRTSHEGADSEGATTAPLVRRTSSKKQSPMADIVGSSARGPPQVLVCVRGMPKNRNK